MKTYASPTRRPVGRRRRIGSGVLSGPERERHRRAIGAILRRPEAEAEAPTRGKGGCSCSGVGGCSCQAREGDPPDVDRIWLTLLKCKCPEKPDCQPDTSGMTTCEDDGTMRVQNWNTCCSRPCTQAHEEQHAADLGPCCRKKKKAIDDGRVTKAEADKEWKKWMRGGARIWSECNAYLKSLECVWKQLEDEGCDDQSSVCCNELDIYECYSQCGFTLNCIKYKKQKPPCPF